MNVVIISAGRVGALNERISVAEYLVGRIIDRETSPLIMTPEQVEERIKQGNIPNVIITSYGDTYVQEGCESINSAIALKRLCRARGGNTALISVDDPRSRQGEFDLYFLQTHMSRNFDLAKLEQNARLLNGMPCRANSASLNRTVIANQFEVLDMFSGCEPVLLVLGGDIPDRGVFSEQDSRKLANDVAEQARLIGGNAKIFITDSSRTNDSQVPTITKILKEQGVVFEHLPFKQCPMNKLYTMMKFAKLVVVTGDSMMMCAESSAINGNARVFVPESVMEDMHNSFLDVYLRCGVLSLLGDEKAPPREIVSIDTARAMAGAVLHRIEMLGKAASISP